MRKTKDLDSSQRTRKATMHYFQNLVNDEILHHSSSDFPWMKSF